MSKKHILVLSVSAGAGHVRAAQALCAAAERGFRQLRLTHVDVMDLVPAGFRKLYADSYIKLVEKMPLAWAYLYQYTDQRSAKSLFDRLRRNIERLNTRKLNRELKRLAPDAIICTHFLPAELLSRPCEGQTDAASLGASDRLRRAWVMDPSAYARLLCRQRRSRLAHRRAGHCTETDVHHRHPHHAAVFRCTRSRRLRSRDWT